MSCILWTGTALCMAVSQDLSVDGTGCFVEADRPRVYVNIVSYLRAKRLVHGGCSEREVPIPSSPSCGTAVATSSTRGPGCAPIAASTTATPWSPSWASGRSLAASWGPSWPGAASATYSGLVGAPRPDAARRGRGIRGAGPRFALYDNIPVHGAEHVVTLAGGPEAVGLLILRSGPSSRGALAA
eukprot:11202147-Lingulodinium_polyedra.AAC.1